MSRPVILCKHRCNYVISHLSPFSASNLFFLSTCRQIIPCSLHFFAYNIHESLYNSHFAHIFSFDGILIVVSESIHERGILLCAANFLLVFPGFQFFQYVLCILILLSCFSIMLHTLIFSCFSFLFLFVMIKSVVKSFKIPVVKVVADRLSNKSALPCTTDSTQKKIGWLEAGPGWISWLQSARRRIFFWANPSHARFVGTIFLDVQCCSNPLGSPALGISSFISQSAILSDYLW